MDGGDDNAGVAELVDAPDLGSGVRKGVGVRVSLLVHNALFINMLARLIIFISHTLFQNEHKKS